MTGRFSTKLVAAIAALSLMGSGVALADDSNDSDVSVSSEATIAPEGEVGGTDEVSEAETGESVDSENVDSEEITDNTGGASTNVVPDRTFRMCLNSALGHQNYNDSAITAAQLKDITGTVRCADFSGDRISSLEGVQYLTNITELEIWYCDRTTSVAPLEKLKNTKLTKLFLDFDSYGSTAKVKFPNLSGLPNLKTLRLSYIPLGDLSNIAKNKELVSVWFKGAQLTKLDALAKLPKIEVVRVETNRDIKDISPLANTSSLRLLSIEDNQLTSIPKSTVKNKIGLDVRGNNIKDFRNGETWSLYSDQDQKISLPMTISNGKTSVDVSSLRSVDGSLPSKVYLAEAYARPLTAHPGSITNGGKTVTFDQVLKDGDWIYAKGKEPAGWFIGLEEIRVSSVSVSGASSAIQ